MNKLFSDFNPVTTQQWIDVIEKDLKGADFKKLIRKTIDGIEFQPFYRKENTENLATLNSSANKFPFIRGYKLNNEWAVRQDFVFDNFAKALNDVENASEKGINIVGFDFGKNCSINQQELTQLLAKVSNAAFLSFENIEDIYYLLKEIDTKNKNIFLNFDPITFNAFTGSYYKDQQKLWSIAADLLTNEIPNIKPVGINLHHYANAGATPTMQLAFGLAIISEYFDFATEMNIPIKNILPNICFNIAVSCEYFLEISKIRAFRYLFAKLVETFDPTLKQEAKTYIHGVTLRRNKTVYDAHVNMLRTTIETLAGVYGGVDSFNTEPYNIVFSNPDAFSYRIASNQQIIIKEEAFADKVADPSGGSYYVENMTIKLIEEAWGLFLKIQDNRGFCDAKRTGFIQKMVNDIVAKEKDLAETGRLSILGTNKYPNRTENLSNSKILKRLEISDLSYPEKEFEPLKIERLSEKFEELRLKTEKSPKIPKVFLFTYGNPAMRRARADFSANFFAVAGFEIIDNLGFNDLKEGIEAAKNSDIIVLCSSDDSYIEMAKNIYPELKNKIIVIAGNPENRAEIEQIGIKNFIHIKSNLYKELTDYQSKLN